MNGTNRTSRKKQSKQHRRSNRSNSQQAINGQLSKKTTGYFKCAC